MKKASITIFTTFSLIICLASADSLYPYPKTRSYSKKSAYSDFGKPSKVNRLPKTKSTSGHMKRTSRGYTYVNPYYRSK